MFDETHGDTAAALPLPVNGWVDPTATDVVPVIVGNALTVPLKEINGSLEFKEEDLIRSL